MTIEDVFDRLYRDHDDPWHFGTSAYEARKRAITIASLPRARYRRAFEPGCSLGFLSEQLAARCDELVAWDASPRAIQAAQARVAERDGVAFAVAVIPERWPSGMFDLIVLSEIGYFLGRDALDEVARRCSASLEPGGDLMVVHWTGPIDGYPLDGADVHARLLGEASLRPIVTHRERDFVLEVLRR